MMRNLETETSSHINLADMGWAWSTGCLYELSAVDEHGHLHYMHVTNRVDAGDPYEFSV